jgi:integrase
METTPPIRYLAPTTYFAVYEHKIISNTSKLSTYRAIVLKNRDGHVIEFTGLEAFVGPYTGQIPTTDFRNRQELLYVCHALTYILSHYHIRRIADISVDMLIEFLRDYAQTPKTPGTQLFRSKQSVEKCRWYVCNFFANLSVAFPTKLSAEDVLLAKYSKRNPKSLRVEQIYVPRIPVKAETGHRIPLLRDIPEEAAWRLVEIARIRDPMIAFAIACQILAGLRASETMNLRQADSPLSNTPGIMIRRMGKAISGIELDLTREYVLRSDFVSVGRIKKERTVDVYKGFMERFVECYRNHLEILKDYPSIEPEYKPMFVNGHGKAMTYANYLDRVKKLIYTYLKPEMLRSTNHHCLSFAQKLESHPFGPHAFRHLFTCKLLMEGLSREDLMYFRGDTSPESADVYLQNKDALLDPLHAMHAQALDMLNKAGSQRYELY